jgi:eukaryotic-like serine/threonine-protein kinase
VAGVTRLAADHAAAGAATSNESATAPTPARPSHSRTRRVALGLLALLLVAAAGYLLVQADFPRARRTALPPQRPIRLVPITALTGWQDWPSLSPDGEHVAFEWAGNRNDNHDIYVTIVGSRDVRRLTTNPADDFAPSWSPNGREIAFLRNENGATRIHVMSALGGPDRTLSDFPAWASISWSSDARFIVAGRVAERDPDRGIYLVPGSGGTPRAIETLRAPAEAHAAAFSPDGRRLAYARCESIDTEGNSVWAERSSQGCQVRLVDVDQGYVPRSAPRRLPVGPMSTVGALTWDRDGKSIVFWGHLTKPGTEQSGDPYEFADHLWRISPDGVHAPERIEVAGLNARRPTTSMSRDRLVFSRTEEDADIFRLVRGREPERILTSSAFDGHAQFSPDGRRIAFGSDRTGTFEIWVVEADGSSERQLTRGLTLYQGSPRWSPDGSLVAFDALEANGDRHIWTIPAEGGAVRQLTKQAGEQSAPTWSHDGQWIYFSHNGSGWHEVWRVRSTGGTPEQISRNGSGVVAFESPDGQHVIYKLGDQDAPIVEASLNGGGSRILVPCVSSFWGFSVVRESLYYMPCPPARAGTIRVLDPATRRDG